MKISVPYIVLTYSIHLPFIWFGNSKSILLTYVNRYSISGKSDFQIMSLYFVLISEHFLLDKILNLIKDFPCLYTFPLIMHSLYWVEKRCLIESLIVFRTSRSRKTTTDSSSLASMSEDDRKKYANAKSISSDQFFGDRDPDVSAIIKLYLAKALQSYNCFCCDLAEAADL